MKSSYIKNNYRTVFESIVFISSPRIIVECGILDGYSLFAMADVAKKTGGRVIGIDLFEDYKHNNANYEQIKNISEEVYPNTVNLIKGDAIESSIHFDDGYIDLIHFDISNTGDRLSALFGSWWKKIKIGGTILFEGGSGQRDSVGWMKKHGETPIKVFIKNDLDKKYCVEYYTLRPFPSLTICKKLGE